MNFIVYIIIFSQINTNIKSQNSILLINKQTVWKKKCHKTLSFQIMPTKLRSPNA